MLAPSPSQSDRPFHGLWSLWGLMQKHDAKMLLRACTLLKSHSDAMDRNADKLVDHKRVAACLASVATACSGAGLQIASGMADEYAKIANNGAHFQNAVFYPKLVAVHEAIEGELSSITLLRVRTDYKNYLVTVPPLFGQDVHDKFPSAIRDIESAGKCIAYELGTAGVFHCMRIMEAGLKSLSKALGIPYAPSWESYLRQIETKITAKHKTKGIKWKRDEAYFRDIAGDLMMVKIAWRNPTMHIVRSYSPDEAEDVYRAVRSFMKRLSEKFSEMPLS